MTVETRAIADIRVEGRVRTDLGDLDGLAASIQRHGALLQPIVIRSDGTLIAGARRLAAYVRLGRAQIEVNVRDDLDGAVDLVKAERDENIERKDFTPSEAVELGRRLEELERPKGIEAQSEAGKNFGRGIASGESPEAIDDRPKHTRETREKVGEAVGMAGSTYAKAKKVVEAAERGEPGAQEAKAEMDKTGKIEPAFRKVTGKPEPAAQAKPLTLDSDRGRTLANAHQKRLEKLEASLSGTARGVTKGIDPAYATAQMTPEELRAITASIDKSLKTLRKFIRSLEGAK